ncbi:tape measure protein [Phocaeicola coprophilus]|jgi:tape measure domain-containing protein|uniref:tape measure protein n=1 Tax=Phocaeicola coprophilus TaxID=387090 RepID=UPI003AF12C64
MATLYFKVSSDYQEVIRLRQECEKLEAQLKKMDVNKSPAAAKALETQLASTRQQMMGLVTEAAKAGAVMENDLKKKLNSASKASDELTEEIIKQRKIIRDTQDDVRRLSDEYSKMGKYSPNSKAKLAELNTAKAALNEQRYSLGELQDQQARNRLEVRKLTREYKEFASGTNNADEIVKSLTDSLKRTAAEIGGLVAIKKFGSDVIEATGKMQQLQVALSTILQDKSKADQLIADIVQFAAKTPFNLDDVATGAKQLLAYGSSADNVVNELSMLGDVASGLQIPIGQLIYLYGTLRTQGRAMTVDIRQFAGRGIPIYEELAKVLGVSKDQVGELVKEGKVGFKEVEQAFKNMTSEGGKFANLMESSAGTWPQRLSNIEDTLFQKMNEFGNKYKEVFEFGIGTAEDLVESLDDVLSVMGGLIAAYGTYKAALITAAVAQKAVGFVESIRLIGMYRKELGLATAAQQAFNLAAKSNVYVTLLAALVGIGTAVYMFSKNADDATTSQGKLNLALAESEKASLSEQRELAKLKGELSALTKGTDEYNEVKDKIVKGFSKYYDGLDEEIEKVGLTEQAYNRLTDAITKSYGARQYEKFKSTQTEELDSLMSENLSKIQERLIDKLGDEEGSKYYTKIRNAILEGSVKAINGTFNLSGLDKETNNALDKVAGKGGILENRAVEQYIANILNAIKSTERLDKLARERFGVDGLKSSVNNGKKDLPKSNILEEIESATKRIKTLKQEITDLRSGKLQAEAGKTVESAIKAKEKELQSVEKTLETLTGVRNKDVSRENSTTSAGGKLSDLERKLALERAKEAVDLENQVEQARINAMADGGEKILAQRELDNKKELHAIDRAKEEYIQKEIQRQKEIFEATEDLKAKKNPKYKKRSFDSSSISVDTSSFDILKENTDKRQVQEDLNAQREAVNAYLAEYGTYMQKRQAVIEQYQDKINKATTEGEKLSLGKQRDSILSGIDEQANKTTSAVSLLFGDMKDKTLKDLETINMAGQKALEFLKSGQWDETTGKSLGITKENFNVWSNDPEKIKAISDALVNNREAVDNLQPAYKKVAVGIREAFDAGDDSKKLEEALARIKDGMNDIMQVGSFLSDTFSSLGEAFGSDALKGVADGINVAMDAANSAMQGAQAGAIFGPIGAAAGAAIGLVGSLASSIAKIHDAKNEKRIQDLQEQIDLLSRSYDKLGESIEKAYSKDASNLINQQNKLLEQQKVLIQQQIREEQDKKKTDNERIKEWQQQIEDINELIENNKEAAVDAIFGEDLKSAIDNFASAYAEAWTNGENKAESAKEMVKNMMRQMVTESIKAATQSSGAMERIRQKLQEFYVDNVLSSWEQDYIYNMAEELQKELDKQFGWADSIMKDDSSKQQNASSKGFTTMSQESANELNGRFTAVYESNLRIEATEQQQTVAITELRGSISVLTSQITKMCNIADETRTILANSYLELQQIRENTGEIIKPIKQIQTDIAEVKRNTSRL